MLCVCVCVVCVSTQEAAHSHKPGKAVAVKDGDRVVSVAALPWGELYETMVASSAGSE